jgi:hypothetical protein
MNCERWVYYADADSANAIGPVGAGATLASGPSSGTLSPQPDQPCDSLIRRIRSRRLRFRPGPRPSSTGSWRACDPSARPSGGLPGIPGRPTLSGDHACNDLAPMYRRWPEGKEADDELPRGTTVLVVQRDGTSADAPRSTWAGRSSPHRRLLRGQPPDAPDHPRGGWTAARTGGWAASVPAMRRHGLRPRRTVPSEPDRQDLVPPSLGRLGLGPGGAVPHGRKPPGRGRSRGALHPSPVSQQPSSGTQSTPLSISSAPTGTSSLSPKDGQGQATDSRRTPGCLKRAESGVGSRA